MAGDPEWELLADALTRVVASGIAERDAPLAICNAIADRSVSVRVLNPFTIERLHKLGFFSGRIGEKADFFLHPGLTELAPSVMIPSRIAPEDFDWQESRPLKPWRDPQASLSPFDWRRDCIHLRRADVTRVLVAPRELGAAKTTVTTPDAPTAKATVIAPALATRANRKPGRAQPSRERAQRAIEALYPNGVPNQTTEPNSTLYRKVGEWLKTKKLPAVSDTTILRAAGRRKP
jgi:hypothetical protein